MGATSMRFCVWAFRQAACISSLANASAQLALRSRSGNGVWALAGWLTASAIASRNNRLMTDPQSCVWHVYHRQTIGAPVACAHGKHCEDRTKACYAAAARTAEQVSWRRKKLWQTPMAPETRARATNGSVLSAPSRSSSSWPTPSTCNRHCRPVGPQSHGRRAPGASASEVAPHSQQGAMNLISRLVERP